MEVLVMPLGLAVVFATVGGAMFGVWKLWCFVVPQLWAAGPAALVHPGFWFFIGAWSLLGLLSSQVLGRVGDWGRREDEEKFW
jgi:hypothetical protein